MGIVVNQKMARRPRNGGPCLARVNVGVGVLKVKNSRTGQRRRQTGVVASLGPLGMPYLVGVSRGPHLAIEIRLEGVLYDRGEIAILFHGPQA